ncbi:MAG: hypothetical protein RL417_1451, partial [Pseudomonadota bacterium]
MRNEDRDALRGGAALLQIPLDDRQLESFARYTELLYTWNERVNLTRIPIEKCVPLQLLDSLLLHRAHPLDRVRS